MSVALSPAEWLASDVPFVRASTDANRSCLTCGAWSCWIGDAGDCLFHAYQRRQEMIDGVPAERRTASKAERMTVSHDVCAGWRAMGSR